MFVRFCPSAASRLCMERETIRADADAIALSFTIKTPDYGVGYPWVLVDRLFKNEQVVVNEQHESSNEKRKIQDRCDS